MQLASARCNRQDAAVSVFFGWMSVKTVEYANFATGTATAWVVRTGMTGITGVGVRFSAKMYIIKKVDDDMFRAA